MYVIAVHETVVFIVHVILVCVLSVTVIVCRY